MSIRRDRRPADNFAIISNDFARDARLSFKARGIGLYLLSHSEGFSSTTASIAKANGCGLDQVRAGLHELETYGYLRRERTRDEAGHNSETDYLITDHLSSSSEGGKTQRRETLPRDTQRGVVQRGKTRPHKKTKFEEEQEELKEERSKPSSWTPDGATESVPSSNAGSSSEPDETAQSTGGDVGQSSGDDHETEPEVLRPDVELLCSHLAGRIVANGSKPPTITKAWRDAARLLLDRDGRELDKVINLIDWCQDHEFWRTNILSMPKFRTQYDQLRLKAIAEYQDRGKRNGHSRNLDDTLCDWQQLKASPAVHRPPALTAS